MASRRTKSTGARRATVPIGSILSAHGVLDSDSRILILLDLLDPSQSLHSICSKYHVGLAVVRQTWLDSQAEIGMAAASNESVRDAVNKLQTTQKFTDLIGFKSRLTVSREIPTGL